MSEPIQMSVEHDAEDFQYVLPTFDEATQRRLLCMLRKQRHKHLDAQRRKDPADIIEQELSNAWLNLPPGTSTVHIDDFLVDPLPASE